MDPNGARNIAFDFVWPPRGEIALAWLLLFLLFPFQCAIEELVFRGWLARTPGQVIRKTLVHRAAGGHRVFGGAWRRGLLAFRRLRRGVTRALGTRQSDRKTRRSNGRSRHEQRMGCDRRHSFQRSGRSREFHREHRVDYVAHVSCRGCAVRDAVSDRAMAHAPRSTRRDLITCISRFFAPIRPLMSRSADAESSGCVELSGAARSSVDAPPAPQ